MKKQHKNLLIFIGIGCLFSLLSTFLFFNQQRINADQLTGVVISVEERQIEIEEASGHRTYLHMDETTRFHEGGTYKTHHVEPDMFIYTFGKKIDNENFQSSGIRILRSPK